MRLPADERSLVVGGLPRCHRNWFEPTGQALAWPVGVMSFAADAYTIAQMFRAAPAIIYYPVAMPKIIGLE